MSAHFSTYTGLSLELAPADEITLAWNGFVPVEVVNTVVVGTDPRKSWRRASCLNTRQVIAFVRAVFAGENAVCIGEVSNVICTMVTTFIITVTLQKKSASIIWSTHPAEYSQVVQLTSL